MNALRKFLPVVAIAVMCVGSSTFASTVSVTFTGVPASDPTLTIQDTTDHLASEAAYIDPYNGKVNGQTVLLFCVDPLHDVSAGDTWTAYVGTPGNLSSLTNTYQVLDYSHLSTSAANTLYEEMAALAAKLEGTAASATTTREELQAAIWQLADPNLTFPGESATFLAAVTSDKTWAAGHPLTSGFEILSDKNNTIQEYIVLTPEPASLLLLGLGLFAVLVWKRRERAALLS